ncbi:hypothetical protein HN803_04730 [candidate division WWE3 bacterium]|jgi:hypothetical protein|nr:hypothetical protein [Candidatus Scalindua sp.]MBT7350068.1 hypothetical protein [candidate division WWE3 bacterium]
MFGFGKCKHKNVSTVQSDGYQYCLKCNKAIYASPIRPEKKCDHEHVTAIQPDGYQYCEVCGLAIPVAPKKNCDHKWIKEHSIEQSYFGNTNQIIFIYCCTECGVRERLSTSDAKWGFPD